MAAILTPELTFIVKVLANFHHRKELANFLRKCLLELSQTERDLNCDCVLAASAGGSSGWLTGAILS